MGAAARQFAIEPANLGAQIIYIFAERDHPDFRPSLSLA